MSNDYFNNSTTLSANTLARATSVEAKFESVAAGFDLLPTKLQLYENRVTYGTCAGVADAYEITLPYAPAAYVAGLHFSFIVPASKSNTGACTINVMGPSALLGAKSVKRTDGNDPAAGDLPAGGVVEVRYDGTNFQLSVNAVDATSAAESASASAASASSASASASSASSSASVASTSAATAAAAAAVLDNVANNAALTALAKSGLTDGDIIYSEAYATQGDGGDGSWEWDASSTEIANGVTILAADEGGTGRWHRRYSGSIDVRWGGAAGDGTTDNKTALQRVWTTISNAGGGKISFPDSESDWNTSGELTFSAAVVAEIEFSGSSGFLKLTTATSGGGMIEVAANSSIRWVNPRFDGNNVLGQNGIGTNTGCHVTVVGGFMKNFPVAGDFTGGKAIANDGWGAYLKVDGTHLENCAWGWHVKRDLVTDASANKFVGEFTNVSAYNCDAIGYFGIKNSTSNDGTLFTASVSGYDAFNCGSIGGVFVFDRASNVKIGAGSVSATAAYNGGTPVAGIFRGRGRKLIISGQINQSADALIDIDPLSNYAIDTSLMSGNRYDLVATGTYDYVFKSDLTDSTHANRYLDNTLIDVRLANDVSTSIVTAATRNGNAFLRISKDAKVMFEKASTFNSSYTNVAAFPDDYYYHPLEGDWTPVPVGTGSAGSMAYTSAGRYWISGNKVFITGRVTFTNKGSYTGNVYITGVPKNSDGSHAYYGDCRFRNVTPGTTAFDVCSEIGNVSTSQVRFHYSISGSGGGRLDWGELSNTTVIEFTMEYLTT